MKRLILSSLLLAGISALGYAQNGFTVKGTLTGNAEGGKVYLQDAYNPDKAILDSAIVRNGTFELKGKIASPAFYSLVIDINDPKAEKKDLRNKCFRSNFYLENSPITYSADLATLTAFYYNPSRKGKATVKGSATQDLYQEYQSLVRPLTKQLTELDQRYMKEYMLPQEEGKDVSAIGIELARLQNKANEQLREQTLAFAREHISSVVGFDLIFNYLSDLYVPFTVAQLDEMLAWLRPHWAGTERFKTLETNVTKSKNMALGQKIIDSQFLNPQGEKVMLSSLIQKGKYTMLEFWASWCAPCRAEIPHLVKVHQKYKDFDIISISVDNRDADWKKAMKEEGMVWKQLRNAQGMRGVISDTYNIFAVPTCIILDKEGRIYKTNMRGAYLDEFLKEAYGY